MTKVQQLKEALTTAQSQKELAKTRFLAKKRELVEVETQLVEATENERAAKEALETYQSTFEIESSVEDERAAEIEDYRGRRMANAMKAIENEAPIAPVSCLTLGTKKNSG
jgi:hypothetical protein